MSKARWSAKDFKDNGLIEVKGVFVKASSQVAKKVDKIEIDFCNKKATSVFDDKAIKNQIAQLEFNELNLPKKTPEQIMRRFQEHGIQFKEIPCGDSYTLPTGEYLSVKYRFEIDPIGAPRMSQSDKWKTDPNHPDPNKRQRKPVQQYYSFKNKLHHLCAENGYKLTETLNILFVVPFPETYNKKKRLALMGQPHDQKPDIDNMEKCWMDSLSNDDCKVWNVHGIKVWGYEGQIIIF